MAAEVAIFHFPPFPVPKSHIQISLGYPLAHDTKISGRLPKISTLLGAAGPTYMATYAACDRPARPHMVAHGPFPMPPWPARKVIYDRIWLLGESPLPYSTFDDI